VNCLNSLPQAHSLQHRSPHLPGRCQAGPLHPQAGPGICKDPMMRQLELMERMLEMLERVLRGGSQRPGCGSMMQQMFPGAPMPQRQPMGGQYQLNLAVLVQNWGGQSVSHPSNCHTPAPVGCRPEKPPVAVCPGPQKPVCPKPEKPPVAVCPGPEKPVCPKPEKPPVAVCPGPEKPICPEPEKPPVAVCPGPETPPEPQPEVSPGGGGGDGAGGCGDGGSSGGSCGAE
jgi:hypothetical protein